MINNKLVCFLFLWVCISSCEKEMRPLSVEELTVAGFQEIMDSLDISCPEEKSEYFFTAIIGGQQACYYDGVDGLSTRMDKVVTFTTPGPSISTNTPITNAANLFRFGILRYSGIKAFEDLVEFWTPHYTAGSDPERYLDSLFAIKEHKIREKEGEFDKFKISLNLPYEYPNIPKAFMNLDLQTHFGPQKDSKLVINSVKKTYEGRDVYYDLDMTLNCILYYWPQTGRKGEWGKIENGHLHAKFKAEFYN